MQQAGAVAHFSRLVLIQVYVQLSIGPDRSSSKMTAAPTRPITPIIDAAECEDITAIRPAVSAGSAIFPRSPAKL